MKKHLSDKKRHAAKHSELSKKPDYIKNSLCEFELEGLISVGFFILQYPKLRMLELYYNFSTKFCDVSNIEDL